MTDNKTIYQTVEFEKWAKKRAETPTLLFEEEFLIDRYFNKERKTVDAGTAGGRIALALQKKGFTQLTGFDYVEESINQARKNDSNHQIQFDTQDARKLHYSDGAFEQAIYAGQILCFIDQSVDRKRALEECYRILQPGSPVIFTVLSFEARQISSIYSVYLNYLRIFRKLSGSNRSIQSLPWLKLGGSFNLGSLLDRSPHNYWYRIDEINNLLQTVGFTIIGMGTTAQFKNNQLLMPEQLMPEDLNGILYIICKRS